MSKEAMKQALEAYCKTLHPLWNTGISRAEAEGFFEAGFRAAIAEAEKQEPVAWRAPNWGHSADEYVYRDFDDPVIGIDGKPSPNNEPLYTTPQQRKPLTDEQIATISVECATVSPSDIYFARAIEAAHGIKE